MLPCSENVRFRNSFATIYIRYVLVSENVSKTRNFKFVLLSLSLNLTEKIRLEN